MRRTMIPICVIEQILLMLVLGIIPLRRPLDLGCDRLAFIPLLADLLLNLLCNLQLVVVLRVDTAAVLCSTVRSLAVEGGGIVHLEEKFTQLAICHGVGVEDNQQRLRVPGASGADVVVRGGLCGATGIADAAVEEALAVAVDVAVEFFEAPEAASRKDGALGGWGELHGR